MKITVRSLHRDFAYFYLGLIIAFSFSGIILNHRRDWYPKEYTYEQKEVTIQRPEKISTIDKPFIQSFSKQWNLRYEGHRVRDENLRVDYQENAILNIDLTTGKGTLEFKRVVPLLGHTIKLHKSTSNFWIWYSDIFGAAMLLIAITGVLIPLGKYGFKRRGWKFAVVGLLFPLLFLFVFS